MSSEKEHAKIVLAAILPNRKDLLDYCLVNLTAEHFESPYRTIFSMMERYYQVSKGILSRQAVEDILKRSNVSDFGIIASYLENYDTLVDFEVSEEDFKWSVNELKELLARKSTEQALLEAVTILRTGIQTPKGQELKGHAEARAAILEKFAIIEHKYQSSDSPSGDMKFEKDEVLEEYAKAKELQRSGESPGILCGVPSLDAILGGFQPGELDLVVGYSSSGKSSFCVQVAWHAAIKQGRNMIFVTSETLRPQIRRKIIARHSKLPMFNCPNGLNTRDLKFGTLTEDEEQILHNVVDDLSSNTAYGHLEVVQIPRGSTILNFEHTLNRYQDQWNIDGCVMDYFALLSASRKRGVSWEENSDTIKEGKNIAATFDNGRGIPIISPWQTTRNQKELADKVGYYTTMALAQTSEATNSADVILSFLEPPQSSRHVKLSAAFIKNRDGEQSGSIEVDVDYATSYFSDASVSSLSSTSAPMDGLFGLM